MGQANEKREGFERKIILDIRLKLSVVDLGHRFIIHCISIGYSIATSLLYIECADNDFCI